ncbi:hypothetical protein [Cohaesibacter gelatinilyticus]|uniref:Uncharacterized protein n=1 Tax=Cohaesibacter gelatinilyticus TaxID=372072 RepID=A0A285PLE3_9HYPH|nr:hypothetical protein [Cohaesibacter gelatinilyticus]SNZ20926.1 hypothetical protein SAMN06265368_4040 [Cohaesibacter gelatinilyticus]
MKVTLPAELRITFFPTPGDDNRNSHSLLSNIGEISLNQRDRVKVLMSSNGREIDLHHSNDAIAIVDMQEIIAAIVNATFNRIAGPEILEPTKGHYHAQEI